MSNRGPYPPNDPYMPSNGTEGALFQERYCWQCVHDPFSRDPFGEDESCPIILRSLDGEQPNEWVGGEDGWGTCTAFHHIDAPLPVQVHPDQMTLEGQR